MNCNLFYFNEAVDPPDITDEDIQQAALGATYVTGVKVYVHVAQSIPPRPNDWAYVGDADTITEVTNGDCTEYEIEIADFNFDVINQTKLLNHSKDTGVDCN